MRTKLGFLALIACSACRPAPLNESQRMAIADSVKSVILSIVENVNQKNMDGVFAVYSSGAESRYVESGMAHPNLDALKQSNQDFFNTVETLRVTPDTIDVMLIGTDVAVVTSPMRIRFKPLSNASYQSTGVWTGVLQRLDGKWQVVQSHESMTDPAALMKALAPPPPRATRPAQRR